MWKGIKKRQKQDGHNWVWLTKDWPKKTWSASSETNGEKENNTAFHGREPFIIWKKVSNARNQPFPGAAGGGLECCWGRWSLAQSAPHPRMCCGQAWRYPIRLPTMCVAWVLWDCSYTINKNEEKNKKKSATTRRCQQLLFFKHCKTGDFNEFKCSKFSDSTKIVKFYSRFIQLHSYIQVNLLDFQV